MHTEHLENVAKLCILTVVLESLWMLCLVFSLQILEIFILQIGLHGPGSVGRYLTCHFGYNQERGTKQ